MAISEKTADFRRRHRRKINCRQRRRRLFFTLMAIINGEGTVTKGNGYLDSKVQMDHKLSSEMMALSLILIDFLQN